MSTYANCPGCTGSSNPVDRAAPRNFIRDLRGFGEGPFFFCASETCDVVYFDESNAAIYCKSDMRMPIGVKEPADFAPVCYCFDFTRGSIRGEIQRDGTTTVPEQIKAGIAAKKCACESRNPQGTCCLGNVNQAVRRILDERPETYTGANKQ